MAQTTQGIISGRVTALRTGAPIASATISWTYSATNLHGAASSNRDGYFALMPLSPGAYVIRVDAGGYQGREIHEIELAVAGRIDLNFQLKPLSETLHVTAAHPSAPGSPFELPVFGPDVELMTAPMVMPSEDRSLLDATQSQVIDPVEIRDLPFFGRDIYTMLVTQPGASSDTGTARGLGLSIDGQRPSSANFMLDGVEANNYLVSGPLLAIAPEAVQEYRVSTSNYSAEFGSTSGYLANAITRAGSNVWHGMGWGDFMNEALDANDFQINLLGLPRPKLREFEPGYEIAGPLLHDRYFVSSSLDYFHSSGYNSPLTVNLPTTAFVSELDPDSLAHRLLTEFPGPKVTNGNQFTAPVTVVPPVIVDRWLATERFDGIGRGGAQRFMARLALARASEPDFIWSPYPAFVSGLQEPATNFAAALTSSFRPQFANEVRFGWSRDTIEWDRAHPEIPTLVDSSPQDVLLPGSLAFYSFRNRNKTYEIADEAFRAFGRHIVRCGGGVLLRRMAGYLTAGQDGEYSFATIIAFSVDLPWQFQAGVDRQSLPALSTPDFNREYAYQQESGFLQDTFRASSRLTLNAGIRYEYFGAPSNTGAQKDGVLVLGAGSDFPQSLGTAQMVFPTSSANQPLYRASKRDGSARVGFSYDVLGNARMVLRGGWGVFYDPPYDNIWQDSRNNNVALATFNYQPGPGGYLARLSSVLPLYTQQAVNSTFPEITLFQQDWKTSYAMTDFLGVEQRIAGNWSLESALTGSLGRRLITTDQINRPFSTAAGASYNPNLPQIAYRGTQGDSDYYALATTLHYGSGTRLFYLSYTWSHSIDNQSDPLAGDFFDLSFTSLTPATNYESQGAFSRQFDSRADRGNSDFDQRHNLVFYSIWDLPAWRSHGILRDWKFSQMAAFRSGFPFTVYAPSTQPASGGTILNNRANEANGAQPDIRQPVYGGFLTLNPADFSAPSEGDLGATGRNAFRGPGFFNVDLSLSRSFAIHAWRESARLTLRADVFNFLNHANLGQPDSLITSPTFGVALYGRTGTDTGFPALAPFRETARQTQILLRLEF